MMLQCMASRDCELVVAIYKAMGGTGSDADSCCGVPGAICDSYRHVVEIRWYNHDLKGSIPPEIGELRSLETL